MSAGPVPPGRIAPVWIQSQGETPASDTVIPFDDLDESQRTTEWFRGRQVVKIEGEKTEMDGWTRLGRGFVQLVGSACIVPLFFKEWQEGLVNTYNGYTRKNIARLDHPDGVTTRALSRSEIGGRAVGQFLASCTLIPFCFPEWRDGIANTWNGTVPEHEPEYREEYRVLARDQGPKRPYSLAKDPSDPSIAGASLQNYAMEKMAKGEYDGITPEGHAYILEPEHSSFIIIPKYVGPDPERSYDFDKVKVMIVSNREKGTKMGAKAIENYALKYSANKEKIDAKMEAGESYYIIFGTTFDGTPSIGLITNYGLNTKLVDIEVEIELDKEAEEIYKKIDKGEIKPEKAKDASELIERERRRRRDEAAARSGPPSGHGSAGSGGGGAGTPFPHSGSFPGSSLTHAHLGVPEEPPLTERRGYGLHSSGPDPSGGLAPTSSLPPLPRPPTPIPGGLVPGSLPPPSEPPPLFASGAHLLPSGVGSGLVSAHPPTGPSSSILPPLLTTPPGMHTGPLLGPSAMASPFEPTFGSGASISSGIGLGLPPPSASTAASSVPNPSDSSSSSSSSSSAPV